LKAAAFLYLGRKRNNIHSFSGLPAGLVRPIEGVWEAMGNVVETVGIGRGRAAALSSAVQAWGLALMDMLSRVEDFDLKPRLVVEVRFVVIGAV
jgi:hypothetical protein